TYWHAAFAGPGDGGPAAAQSCTQRVAEMLRESVRLRLISDVPLGLFLSGGIDSTALATVATEVAGSRVKTVTIGFDQPDFDESAVAQQIAKQLGTEHRTVPLTGAAVLADLPEILQAVD